MGSVLAWWLGHQWPSAIAVGAAAFVTYTSATVVAGQEYDRYAGNVEKAFLLYVAIPAAAVALLVISFRALMAAGDLRPVCGCGAPLVTPGTPYSSTIRQMPPADTEAAVRRTGEAP